MDTESNRDASQPALDLEHERARQILDAQAQAWAGAARKWLWLLGITGLMAAAVAMGFLLY